MPYGCDQAAHFVPFPPYGSLVNAPTEQRFDAVVLRGVFEAEHAVIREVPDAGRKAEAQ